jgi:hypothetical protein
VSGLTILAFHQIPSFSSIDYTLIPPALYQGTTPHTSNIVSTLRNTQLPSPLKRTPPFTIPVHLCHKYATVIVHHYPIQSRPYRHCRKWLRKPMSMYLCSANLLSTVTNSLAHKKCLLPSAIFPLCSRHTFLASLILASKFLWDQCYSNLAWAKFSGLGSRKIGRHEEMCSDGGPGLVLNIPHIYLPMGYLGRLRTLCPMLRVVPPLSTPSQMLPSYPETMVQAVLPNSFIFVSYT